MLSRRELVAFGEWNFRYWAIDETNPEWFKQVCVMEMNSYEESCTHFSFLHQSFDEDEHVFGWIVHKKKIKYNFIIL